MSRPSLMRLAGLIILAASFFVFAYGIASVFYGHIAVTAVLILIFGLMLHFGFCLMDKGDEEKEERFDSISSFFIPLSKADFMLFLVMVHWLRLSAFRGRAKRHNGISAFPL